MNSIDINAYHPFMGGLENDVIVVPRDSYCPCFTYIILHRRWHVFPFPFFRGLLSVAQHLGSPAPDMRYSEVQCHRRPQVDSQTQGMHTTDPDDDDCHLFFFFFFLLMIIVHLFLLSWFYVFISVLSLSLLPLYTMIVVPFWTASGAAHFEVAAGLMADQWLEQSIWRSSQAHVSWPSASWPSSVSAWDGHFSVNRHPIAGATERLIAVELDPTLQLLRVRATNSWRSSCSFHRKP